MPILTLTPEQVMYLSALAMEPVSVASPVVRHYFIDADEMSEEALQQGLTEFLDDELVLLDHEGKAHLSRELEAVFWTMNSPHDAVRWMRKSSLAVGETHLYRNGNLWVREDALRGGEVIVITYPHKRRDMSAWFEGELLVDLTFDEKDFSSQSWEISPAEMAVLFGMQQIYRRRVEAGGSLEGGDLWITEMTLGSPAVRQSFASPDQRLLTDDQALEFLNDPEAVRTAADKLVNKELLWSSSNRYAFGNMARQLFDPGRLRDLVALQIFGEPVVLKLLYIYDGGYGLLEPDAGNGASGQAVRLSSIPGSTSKADLFERLMPPEPATVVPSQVGMQRTVVHQAQETPPCPQCGATVQPGQRFCEQCGASLEKGASMERCPECQAPVPPGARFCIQCGAPLMREAPPERRQCPNCQKPVEPDTRFCRWCGHQLGN